MADPNHKRNFDQADILGKREPISHRKLAQPRRPMKSKIVPSTVQPHAVGGDTSSFGFTFQGKASTSEDNATFAFGAPGASSQPTSGFNFNSAVPGPNSQQSSGFNFNSSVPGQSSQQSSGFNFNPSISGPSSQQSSGFNLNSSAPQFQPLNTQRFSGFTSGPTKWFSDSIAQPQGSIFDLSKVIPSTQPKSFGTSDSQPQNPPIFDLGDKTSNAQPSSQPNLFSNMKSQTQGQPQTGLQTQTPTTQSGLQSNLFGNMNSQPASSSGSTFHIDMEKLEKGRMTFPTNPYYEGGPLPPGPVPGLERKVTAESLGRKMAFPRGMKVPENINQGYESALRDQEGRPGANASPTTPSATKKTPSKSLFQATPPSIKDISMTSPPVDSPQTLKNMSPSLPKSALQEDPKSSSSDAPKSVFQEATKPLLPKSLFSSHHVEALKPQETFKPASFDSSKSLFDQAPKSPPKSSMFGSHRVEFPKSQETSKPASLDSSKFIFPEAAKSPPPKPLLTSHDIEASKPQETSKPASLDSMKSIFQVAANPTQPKPLFSSHHIGASKSQEISKPTPFDSSKSIVDQAPKPPSSSLMLGSHHVEYPKLSSLEPQKNIFSAVQKGPVPFNLFPKERRQHKDQEQYDFTSAVQVSPTKPSSASGLPAGFLDKWETLRSEELPIQQQVDILLHEWILKCGPPQVALDKVGQHFVKDLEWKWNHKTLQVEWENYVKKWGDVDRNILETFYVVQKLQKAIDIHHNRGWSKHDKMFIDEKLFDEVYIRKLKKKNVMKYEDDYRKAVDNLKKRKAEEQDDIRGEGTVAKKARVEDDSQPVVDETVSRPLFGNSLSAAGNLPGAIPSVILEHSQKKRTSDHFEAEEGSPSKKAKGINAVPDEGDETPTAPKTNIFKPLFSDVLSPVVNPSSALQFSNDRPSPIKRTSDHVDIAKGSPSKEPRGGNAVSSRGDERQTPVKEVLLKGVFGDSSKNDVNNAPQLVLEKILEKRSNSSSLQTERGSPSKEPQGSNTAPGRNDRRQSANKEILLKALSENLSSFVDKSTSAPQPVTEKPLQKRRTSDHLEAEESSPRKSRTSLLFASIASRTEDPAPPTASIVGEAVDQDDQSSKEPHLAPSWNPKSLMDRIDKRDSPKGEEPQSAPLWNSKSLMDRIDKRDSPKGDQTWTPGSKIEFSSFPAFQAPNNAAVSPPATPTPKFTFTEPSPKVAGSKNSSFFDFNAKEEPTQPQAVQTGWTDFLSGDNKPSPSPFVLASASLTPSINPSRATSPATTAATTSAGETDNEHRGADSPKDEQLDLSATANAGEENEDVLRTVRARVQEFYGEQGQEKGWVVRGVGELKVLKDKVTSKVRVVVRPDRIPKVLLNARLLPAAEYTLASSKRVNFVVADGEGGLARWLISVGKENDAEELAKLFEENKNN